MPEKASDQEIFAVSELNYFVGEITGVILDERKDSEPLPQGNVILIGTLDSNRYINELYNKGAVMQKKLDDEELIVEAVSDEGQDFLLVVGKQGRGVIYAVYELIEKMIEAATGLSPADPDFYLNRVSSLTVENLSIRSAPFYPVRCALFPEDPTWMSRHRLNVSGAEGVWSGTGIDDGLGTAFKYVYDSQFDDMQDEPFSTRWKRITALQKRTRELNEKGIDSYLFMYVMGEPTKAMMSSHPELLEDAVEYQHSRNGEWYKPISWTKPAARDMIKELVKSIVRTYSPWLTGFHLRSWGGETRAPAGNGDKQQEMLWELYYDIISAAREVDPNFKFIISGYNSHWLRDPERIYAAKLPRGSILMSKWGLDGEPTSDPGIEVGYINNLGIIGQSLLILSHDVEEVMPLWMLEADLFAKGVRKYADNPGVNALVGFTLQGETSLAQLDKLVSARMNWDPHVDYVALMKNYLISYYGASAAPHILTALRINSVTLSDYFSDYAGSLSLTGKYGNGSRGYATRFWNIIGNEAVKDTLSIPDIKTVKYAKERFTALLPRQQESANEIASARKLLRPSTYQAELDYYDGLHIMKMWVRFFESRTRLVEAREEELQVNNIDKIMQKIYSAIEYSKEMRDEISEINKFISVFDYNNETARKSLITTMTEEIDFLKNFDPPSVINTPGQNGNGKEQELFIENILVHPSPISDVATFCYNLTSNADDVTINIYTVTGRLVRTITEASAKAEYNEEDWNSRDEDGRKLASGTYFYKIAAKRGNKKVQKTGKLSIIR